MLSFVMTTTFPTPSTQKVRRDVLGGKRADGHQRDRPIQRPDPSRIRLGAPDPSLTGVAGLVPFGAFLAEEGLDRALHDAFGALKGAPSVVYPMAAQMRLLMDAFAVGEARVFGLEALAADPLFVRLAGGVVPSLDTVYRDLARFDHDALAALEGLMAAQGLRPLGRRLLREVFLDVDTTVEPLFGSHEGAAIGPNPRSPGRPSYHPVLARVAETDTCVGALLRPGDTAFGEAEVPLLERWIDRLREAVGPACVIHVRIDSAGDCAEVFAALDRKGCWGTVKARLTPDLGDASATLPAHRWRSVDWDANGQVVRQVAEVDFARQSWGEHGTKVRVVAVRSRERDNGKRVYLWNHLDFTVQAFLTNDWFSDGDDVAPRYDARAGIEPLIGEWKRAWGIGQVPSRGFDANHATLLLKLLTHNLLRRYVLRVEPTLQRWRAPWLRRALLAVPGRLVRSGRCWTLRLAPRPMLNGAKGHRERRRGKGGCVGCGRSDSVR
jgi:hypothetical protein